VLGYGGWMFATNVVYPALAPADQFVIGSLMGVASVAHYGVPMNLVQRSAAILVALGRTLFPACPVYPVTKLKRWEHARHQSWPMVLPPFVLRR
jgi:hypothetical protein